MPIYEYECQNCCLRFEVKRHFSEDGGTPCPQCQGDTRRIFSPVPIIFKGPGFYVTDNRKDHDRPSPEVEAGKFQPDTKSEN